tara:strand:- start:3366 stop:3974 length:609 start_codon:yes stop_codon:yes gene_type:complete
MENMVIGFENTQKLFSKLLCEALCETETNERERCLITGDYLEEDCIKMKCNHSFNYDAIFNEVKSQKHKNKLNHLETQKLMRGEIKCPYCRTVQKGLLPYRANYPKIRYVNWPPILIMKSNKCCAILKSGKRKGEMCGKPCYEKYCGSHMHYLKQKQTSSQKNYPVCQAIIKSGKRKGEICGCKLKSKYIQNKRCGKHLNIK